MTRREGGKGRKKGVRRGERERRSDRHGDIQRVEKTRGRRKKTGIGVLAYGCLVCQACDVAHFLSTLEYSEDDIVSVMAPHPCQRGAQLGLKLIR